MDMRTIEPRLKDLCYMKSDVKRGVVNGVDEYIATKAAKMILGLGSERIL